MMIIIGAAMRDENPEKILKRLHNEIILGHQMFLEYSSITMVSKTFNFVNAADGQRLHNHRYEWGRLSWMRSGKVKP
jgi:hypothetical protein